MSTIPTITIDDRMGDAVRNLALSREGAMNVEKAINDTMVWWVSFVMHKQTVASKPGIRQRLMARAETAKVISPAKLMTKSGRKESTAKRYMELKGSRAASIVWATNYEGVRWMDAKGFFGTVGKFIARRQYSVGYHKAGFRPALWAFKAERGLPSGAAPLYKRASGTAIVAHAVSDNIFEATVTNKATGVDKNPGGGAAAVQASREEAIAQAEKFTRDNIRDHAKRLGLNPT